MLRLLHHVPRLSWKHIHVVVRSTYLQGGELQWPWDPTVFPSFRLQSINCLRPTLGRQHPTNYPCLSITPTFLSRPFHATPTVD